MIGRWLRRLAVTGAVGTAVWFLVKALRGDPLPAYESGGTAFPRPEPALHRVPDPEPDAVADEVEEPAAAMAEDPPPTPEPAPVSAPVDGAPWVEAVADQPAPAAYPVKAKLKSGIYHLPGMLNYDRTVPDRWYTTAEAAEADDLRRAKR